MADDRKLDETITTWLEDAAPTAIPQRVLTATFERTRRSRQQLGWRGVLGSRQMPRFAPALGGAAIVVMAAVLALSFSPLFSAGGPPTPSPSPTAPPSISPGPTAPPVAAELLHRFLDARIAGVGAENFLSPGEDFPLLYATSSGAPYERAEFEPVPGYEWPYDWAAFKVRLFAADAVVEQLVFTPAGGSPRLEYVPDGFGTEIAPTTENGRPLAVPYSVFSGEATVHIAHPWVFRGDTTSIQLIPAGPGRRPTTDGGERNSWDRLVVMADPAPRGTDCPTGTAPANAGELAEGIRSDPGLDATDPVPVAGGAEGLMMDVRMAVGATGACGLFGDTEPQAGRIQLRTGDRMRLYLFDAPEGSSMRILAVVIRVAESDFDRAVAGAPPVVEFHVP